MEIFYAVTLSLRQLYRFLRKQNLFRRYRKSNITEVTLAILQNISGSSKLFGYRLMHQKLRADYRETVRILLKILDAAGVELRYLIALLEEFTFPSDQIIYGISMDMTRLNHMDLQFMVP